ncbi:MAG TPA: hypothetical protein VJ917_03110 [Saprospiraceae bacterium]|nr:hypothetical protein [Saprospiraceae bacterium]
MDRLKLIITLPVLALFFTLCSKDNNPVVSGINNMPGELPLLNRSNKIGTIKGFNPSNPPATSDSMAVRWQEALNSGMSVGRLQIDWPELEPVPGIFNQTLLEEELSKMKNQGLQTFLLISAYDSEGPIIPADLQGKDFNDPELIERFKTLMDWVIPMLIEYDGFLISVINEADNDFAEHPGLYKEIVTFLAETRKHVHQINDNMAVTATIAEGSLDDGRPGIREIIAESDVACWNFYGTNLQFMSPYFVEQTESEVKADLQRLIEISGDKKIVIQELGMHSGNRLLNSSEEIQRRFFKLFFEEMNTNEQIKVAYNFQLVDWSPEVSELLAQGFESEEVPQEFIDQWKESLETVGLINYSDGSRKEAWHEFLFWLEELN